ncbi:ABC transporter substrate-binding protein [Pseudonocardia sp. MH-G8]|uniref:ABC transporter substrate-binding protein n=1 Tax=Pseudonocardia sp. MH-G8 TaxID=1854588 RepID=UPI000B9FDCCA|nr:ABC transporter substrate-binding protein [Pseudonocardia sp. MH-G8]OZM78719.1 ABC transporter substrate-binding protein [Pseudonocardia sp. MH-G8]
MQPSHRGPSGGDRRRFRGTAVRLGTTFVALLVAIGMTGCATSTEVGNSGETVAVSHKFGETEVPKNPTRVVTVGWNDQDFVLALGVVPIVTRAWFDSYNDYPWVQEATGGKGVETLSGEGIQYEDIAAAEPDVIFAIYETIDRATYDRLSQIAPTVIQSGEYADEETPWHEQLLRTAKALGKDAEAQALADQVNAKIDEAKAANPAFASTVLVEDFGPENGGHYLIGKGDPRRTLFDALGFGAQDHVGDVSEENVSLLDRDVLFVNGATKEQMMTSPVFTRLDVVQSDRTLYTTFDSNLSGALSYSGPKALLYALDQLVPQLSNAVNGRPIADLSNA